MVEDGSRSACGEYPHCWSCRSFLLTLETWHEQRYASFQVILDNILLTWTYFKVSLYTEGGRAYLQVDPVRDLGESIQFMIERDLSAAWFIANEALDQELPLLSVEFKHAGTAHSNASEEVFHCPAVFNAPHNRIGFEKSWLEQPLEKSEPETSRIFLPSVRKSSLR